MVVSHAVLRCFLFLPLLLLTSVQPARAEYRNNIDLAAQWLVSRQNNDGSWGSAEGARFILTVETVQALYATGLRNNAYYRGVTWLENHAAGNADYSARAALALAAHGDNVAAAVAGLSAAQNTTVAGRSGWGVGAGYLQSPLDTALVLNSLAILGGADEQAAIDYLKSAQLPNAGWAAGQETTTDPFTTAWVVKALAPLQAQDATLPAALTNAANTLNTLVTSGAPPHLQALSAHAALLLDQTSVAQPHLAALVAAQASDGSWSQRVYDTALALRALAAADGLDSAANLSAVDIPDAKLRAAINTALGRNVMDSLYRGDLARLTTLNANGAGIGSLTGLEWAVNLTHADLRNNHITSTGPINGLAQLNAQLAGNPVSGDCNGDGVIDIADVQLIQQALIGAITLTQQQKQRSDIYPSGVGDGVITISDLWQIQQKILAVGAP